MPRRRGRGEGSIYPCRNGFAASVSLGFDQETGRRLRRTVYGRTRQECRDKLHVIQEDRKQGLPVKTPVKITLDQHFQAWLTAKKQTVRASTWVSYRYLYETHIKPALGRLQLRDLDYRTIDQFYVNLDEKAIKLQERKGKATAKDDRKPKTLSRRTVQMIAYVLRSGLEDAVSKSILPRNPARQAAKRTSKRKEARFLNADELARFRAAAHGARLEDGFIVALTTGLRPGEWLGLPWSAIDWKAKKLEVRQALHEDEHGRPFISSDLKTPAARRKITLSRETMAALRRQKKRQIEEKLAAGAAWQNEHDLVFTNHSGGIFQLSNVRRHDLAPICKAAGLQDVGLHTLRHTNAALMIAAGADAKTVQARLGHEDIRTTLGTYGHLFACQDERAADLIDSFFARLKPASDLKKK